MGGPTWSVKLGRRDSTTASRSLAESNLPSFRDSLDRLTSLFGSKGLSQRDMVALSDLSLNLYDIIKQKKLITCVTISATWLTKLDSLKCRITYNWPSKMCDIP